MAGITLEQAQVQLDKWLAASAATAGNQAYEIAGRRLTRANAEEIMKQVEYWDRKVKELAAAGTAAGRRGPKYGVTG